MLWGNKIFVYSVKDIFDALGRKERSKVMNSTLPQYLTVLRDCLAQRMLLVLQIAFSSKF